MCKQPALIAASAPIERIDIALFICFLVHNEAAVYRVKLPEANRNQDPASCHESATSDELRPKLITQAEPDAASALVGLHS